MSKERRGLRTLRTMAGLVDGRRLRTPAGALLELAGIATEKERLRLELERLREREGEIHARLTELTTREAGLSVLVKTPVVPVPGGAPPGLRSRELNY